MGQDDSCSYVSFHRCAQPVKIPQAQPCSQNPSVSPGMDEARSARTDGCQAYQPPVPEIDSRTRVEGNEVSPGWSLPGERFGVLLVRLGFLAMLLHLALHELVTRFFAFGSEARKCPMSVKPGTASIHRHGAFCFASHRSEDSSDFREALRRCCAELLPLSALELLERYRAEARVSVLGSPCWPPRPGRRPGDRLVSVWQHELHSKLSRVKRPEPTSPGIKKCGEPGDKMVPEARRGTDYLARSRTSAAFVWRASHKPAATTSTREMYTILPTPPPIPTPPRTRPTRVHAHTRTHAF